MKNKILIPLLIIGVLAAFFSFKYAGDNSTEGREVIIMQTTMKAIKEGHYSPRAVNDSFSLMVYNKVLDELDNSKRFFTLKDINELGKYKYKIDDEINEGSLEFYHKVNDIFLKRIDDIERYYKEILKTPFTFNTTGEVQLNGEKEDFAADSNALKDRWRDYLKYRVLVKYVELKDDQNKRIENKDTTLKKQKTDAELEADSRAYVLKSHDAYFKRLHKIKENDRFTMFMNTITQSEDPHTDYFPPQDKKRFDEEMSGVFFGIGAQLKDDNGKIKITMIIPGSPCYKQGELKANDQILKVAQGAAEPVDVEGMEIDDVVKMIRGKKGSEVRLTVKEMSGAIKVIPIIRGEVQLDDKFAKSVIIESKGGPVGYILLPEFYSDFQHINGRRCADDIKKEVLKLKAEGVKGIILDLRTNTGGSLSDVVDMAGLFIDHGPIVQVKSNDAAPMLLPDNDNGTIYDGPLAIMVSQESASASEILAAAMQDYKRAVIIGTTTYGKGTVQKVISLDDFLDPVTRLKLASGGNMGVVADGSDGDNSIGSLKITIQKFYRINGGSTQLRGVTPDITLPDPYEMVDLGERHEKSALKWDEIPPAPYKVVSDPVDVATLAALSNTRVNANPTFKLIEENAARIKKEQEDDSYPLKESDYRKQMDENNLLSKKIDELQKGYTPYDIVNTKEDMKVISQDSTVLARNTEWIKNLKKDIYLNEVVNVINDMEKQGSSVELKTGVKY
jgi:carboxyl-terminal processing protease